MLPLLILVTIQQKLQNLQGHQNPLKSLYRYVSYKNPPLLPLQVTILLQKHTTHNKCTLANMHTKMTGANSKNSECNKGNASTNNEDGNEGGNNGTYTNDSKHNDSDHSDSDNNGSGLGMDHQQA